MSKLPKLSGKEVIRILCKEFGFEISRRKGSHISLVKFIGNGKITTIVPMHSELKTGTLLGILRLAGIKKEVFLKKIK